MPKSLDETSNVVKTNNKISVSTYGLPPIFWWYFLASFIVYVFLVLAVLAPLQKILTYPDIINQLIGYSTFLIILSLPIITFLFFVFSKTIEKSNNEITIKYAFFKIPFFKRVYILQDQNSLETRHFMDSPNLARMNNVPNKRQFYNQGYFELIAKLKNKKEIRIDRSSIHSDLKNLKSLLETC